MNSIVQIYPSFIVGRSDNIEDYSIGELLKYNTIFLSGFEYYSLKNAEDIINKLAEQGVKIVIDMTHIPVDRSSNRMHFLWCECTRYYVSTCVSNSFLSRERDKWVRLSKRIL